jgi:hypothetical protein
MGCREHVAQGRLKTRTEDLGIDGRIILKLEKGRRVGTEINLVQDSFSAWLF